MGVTQVVHDDCHFATIIRADTPKNTSRFFSKPTDTLQVAKHFMSAGEASTPHSHHSVSTTITKICEVCYIISGTVLVFFFSSDGTQVAQQKLGTGDVVIQHAGGHQYQALSTVELLEVKQGPYDPQNVSVLTLNASTKT